MNAGARVRVAGFSGLEDHELMLQVQRAEDNAAFEVLYERHRVRAHRLARRICFGYEAGCAAEAVQEAFLAVWRSRDRYRGERGSVEAWIMGIVRNRAIDVLRRQRRHPPGADAAHEVERRDSGYRVENEVEHHDEAARLREQLRDLPPAQQEVIELAYFGGLTHQEIAVALGLPSGTVKGRMRLGLDKLRVAAAADLRLAASKLRPADG